jgi:hypothetical protein
MRTASQCDKAASRRDAPVSQRDKASSQRDTEQFALRRIESRRVQQKKSRDSLTFRCGEPNMPGTNPSLERAEGLAANGGTRILDKDSEVRTGCGS